MQKAIIGEAKVMDWWDLVDFYTEIDCIKYERWRPKQKDTFPTTKCRTMVTFSTDLSPLLSNPIFAFSVKYSSHVTRDESEGTN
ncbi:hypothetical protein TNIN_116551 [Trichonephila inaurata madagascariensis]|uniref:Uncharacterized protein n=1 Tax=Trichonephila inaurata madagascariensis TaxID=2747483 RepID=A0A8X6IWN8_9ARAC|nr:hypothetical protein TNIN_116551 [Trichonephila inaurata madagascariensis]